MYSNIMFIYYAGITFLRFILLVNDLANHVFQSVTTSSLFHNFQSIVRHYIDAIFEASIRSIV